MSNDEKTIRLSDLIDLLGECEQLVRDDENFANVDVADRAEDGASIAQRLVELAEEKLGYVRVLKPTTRFGEEGAWTLANAARTLETSGLASEVKELVETVAAVDEFICLDEDEIRAFHDAIQKAPESKTEGDHTLREEAKRILADALSQDEGEDEAVE